MKAKQDSTLLRNCVMCNFPYYIGAITAEQKYYDDKDFCPLCWNEIMTIKDEESLSYIDSIRPTSMIRLQS